MDDNADIISRLDQIRDATLLASKEIYTTAEACLFLGVKRSYLYELVRNHKVGHFKSRGGKFTYFRREDLEAWMTTTAIPATDRQPQNSTL